jgi:sulfonate dioxygenase
VLNAKAQLTVYKNMSTTVTSTVSDVTQQAASLKLRPAEEEEYRYAHLLPSFSADRYPPLTPFEHVDPGHRALSHPNPRAFLEGATSVSELTPRLGTEVIGINLAELDNTGRDQLALEVCLSNYVLSN